MLAIVLEHVPTPAFVVAARQLVGANQQGISWLAESRANRNALLRRGGPDPHQLAVTAFHCSGVLHHLAILRWREALPARWNLTRREAEVAELIARGSTNHQIAGALDCALKTVEHHVSAILRKAGVENRASLIAALLGR